MIGFCYGWPFQVGLRWDVELRLEVSQRIRGIKLEGVADVQRTPRWYSTRLVCFGLRHVGVGDGKEKDVAKRGGGGGVGSRKISHRTRQAASLTNHRPIILSPQPLLPVTGNPLSDQSPRRAPCRRHPSLESSPPRGLYEIMIPPHSSAAAEHNPQRHTGYHSPTRSLLLDPI